MSPSNVALWGSAELCQALGVTRSTLAYWREHRPDFPVPTRLQCGPVWDSDAVKLWFARNVAAHR